MDMNIQQTEQEVTGDIIGNWNSLQIVCVHTQDAQYAIELKYVECILPLMALQPVPGGAHFLAGLLDYYGKSLAVIDLGIWLGLDHPEPYHLDTSVVVCGTDRHAQLGLIVSEVNQVEPVRPDAIHMQGLFGKSEAPFTASLKLDSGITLLLDLPRILNINFTAANALPTVLHPAPI